MAGRLPAALAALTAASWYLARRRTGTTWGIAAACAPLLPIVATAYLAWVFLIN
jgi:hypothetical protein